MPEQPDTKLSGVLKISESGEITVDLAGIFVNPDVTSRTIGALDTLIGEETAPDPRRILGHLKKGGRITLDRCLWQNRSLSLPSGLSTSTVLAELAVVGAHYGENEEARFSEFSFSIEGLDDWISKSGIAFEQDLTDIENWEVLIRVHRPDDIMIHLPSDGELRFKFDFTFPSVSIPVTKASVQQNAVAMVKLREPQPIKCFSYLAIKLCHFLTLALNQSVSLKLMTGYLDVVTTGGENRRMPLQIYGQFAPWAEKKPTIRLQEILFRYPHVASQLDNMIRRWFENYETFEPAFNLYFSVRAQPSQFVDTKILWLSQALETLHRRSSDETEMPAEEFSSLVESVIQGCPKSRREWLGYRLHYANALSFRHRIERLLKPFERWFGDHEEPGSLVNRACDTRNYLTHYDEANTRNRATGSDEMFKLYEKLETLFQLHLLKLIGFDTSSIDAIIEGNHGLRRRLGIRDS